MQAKIGSRKEDGKNAFFGIKLRTHAAAPARARVRTETDKLAEFSVILPLCRHRSYLPQLQLLNQDPMHSLFQFRHSSIDSTRLWSARPAASRRSQVPDSGSDSLPHKQREADRRQGSLFISRPAYCMVLHLCRFLSSSRVAELITLSSAHAHTRATGHCFTLPSHPHLRH